MENFPPMKAIQAAGGPAALGNALGCSSQAISQWRRIPAERVLDVERITGIPREDLRPDLYPRDRNVTE
jgi:DNA-binding transcriptional regulator YdaS (Cro superfamily)